MLRISGALEPSALISSVEGDFGPARATSPTCFASNQLASGAHSVLAGAVNTKHPTPTGWHRKHGMSAVKGKR